MIPCLIKTNKKLEDITTLGSLARYSKLSKIVEISQNKVLIYWFLQKKNPYVHCVTWQGKPRHQNCCVLITTSDTSYKKQTIEKQQILSYSFFFLCELLFSLLKMWAELIILVPCFKTITRYHFLNQWQIELNYKGENIVKIHLVLRNGGKPLVPKQCIWVCKTPITTVKVTSNLSTALWHSHCTNLDAP